MPRAYILSESDGNRLHEINDAVKDITGGRTGGRYVGRRTRRGGGGGGGDTYNGQFKVTAGTAANTVNISAGRVINGTASTAVPATSGFAVSTNDFVYLEISYGTTYSIAYKAGATYPDQEKKDDKWCIRFLIAEKVDDTWQQRRYQEIHNTRSVE